MNIKELLEEDNFSCKKMGNHDGGVYGSSCPWCGGDDRFRCWPNAENGGNYFCQKCGRKGSVTRYLTEFRKMNLTDACLLLGYTPKRRRGSLRNKKVIVTKEWQPNEYKSPTDRWQAQADILVFNSVQCIRSNGSLDYQSYLNQRGLTDDTIEKFQLGFIYKDEYQRRENWDLPEKLKQDGKRSKLYIPAGFVIPYIYQEKIVKIKIRKLYPDSDFKYYMLEGSSNIPMVIGDLSRVIIVESELDAILINQKAGDLVTAIALGSAQIRPDKAAAALLNDAEIILISLDSDEAGAGSYWNWWKTHFPQSKRWPPINGKDPTEAYQNGLNIRDWIIAGISAIESKNSRLNVKEISSGGEKLPVFDDHESIIKKFRELKDSKSIIVDIHTSGPHPFSDEITAIQIYGSPKISISANDKNLQKDAKILLSELLNSNIRKIFHDAKPQLKFLKQAGFNVSGPFFDTMLAAQLLDAGIKGQKYDLNTLSARYLSRDCLDKVELIKKLTKILISKLNYDGLSECAELEFACLPAAVEMELNGMLLDLEKWEILGNKLSTQKNQLEKSLHSELGFINLDYQKELVEAIRLKGIEIPDTKRQTLVQYGNKYPILKIINEYRRIAKLVQGYILPIPQHVHKVTGRIHAEYNQIGAATGRFSCKNPNLQQIPRDKSFRSCFIPEPGSVFVIADYSQMELRVAAEISEDQTMLNAYNRGLDLHRLTASIIVGKAIEEITQDERQAAKAVNFGLIFGMGAEGLMNYAREKYGVQITIQEANDFRSRFLSAYAGISAWHNRTGNIISRETRTLGNRRRKWGAPAPLTELLNTPIQGTAADIIKKALCLLPQRLRDTKAKLVGCVHDEIILEVPLLNAKKASKILEETMIEAGQHYLKSVPIEVDVSVTDSWAGK